MKKSNRWEYDTRHVYDAAEAERAHQEKAMFAPEFAKGAQIMPTPSQILSL